MVRCRLPTNSGLSPLSPPRRPCLIPSIVSPELNAEAVRGRRGLYGQDGCKKGAAKYPEMISNIATSACLFSLLSSGRMCEWAVGWVNWVVVVEGGRAGNWRPWCTRIRLDLSAKLHGSGVNDRHLLFGGFTSPSLLSAAVSKPAYVRVTPPACGCFSLCNELFCPPKHDLARPVQGRWGTPVLRHGMHSLLTVCTYVTMIIVCNYIAMLIICNCVSMLIICIYIYSL